MMNVHLIWIGLLLGCGAAIPIGPLNLEIIRRNLRFGTSTGLAVGLGACTGDVTYLTLLCMGALSLLSHPWINAIFTLLGAVILAWFGVSALRMKPINNTGKLNSPKPIWRHYLEGYALVMINPYTVLFWLSVSSQIARYSRQGFADMLLMGAGVILGVVSWACGLNIALHFTRHRLSESAILWLNRLGGIIILGFAAAGIYHLVAIDF